MRQVAKGSTNVSIDVYIIDSTDGTPELGVVWNAAGMDLEYRREGAAVVNVTEASLSALTDAHSDGGFLEIGHGLYRFDVPDAAFASGASTVSIQGTVTGMIILPQTIQLVDFDPEDGVRLGLTAMPNAAADAAGGLPISDAGGLDLDARLDAAVSSRLAPTVAARTLDVTATGAAGIDWGNVENPTTAVDLSGTDIQLCDTVTTNTDMRGTDSAALASVCTEARLAELDAANLPTDVDAVLTDTARIQPQMDLTMYGGYVWLSDAASNTNTVTGTDGTPDNPVSTIAAAKTIADNTGLRAYRIVSGNYTLVAAHNKWRFEGFGDRFNAGIALGGQNISDSYFHNLNVSGTGTTAAGQCTFSECFMNSVDVGSCYAWRCQILVSLTISAGATLFQCIVENVTGGAGTLSIGTAGTEFWETSGSLIIADSSDAGAWTIGSLKDNADLTIDATNTAGTIRVMGDGRVTDSSAGATVQDFTQPLTAMRGTDSALLASSAPTNWSDLSITATTGRVDVASIEGGDASNAINAEVVDVLRTDTSSLPGQAAPTLTPTIEEAIMYLYKAFRNRKTQTATQWSLYADDESTVDQKATVSDDGTTATKQEIVTGP